MSRESSPSTVWLLSVPMSFLVASMIATTITVTLLAHPHAVRPLMVLWQAVAVALALWALHLFSLTYVANRTVKNPIFPGYNFILAMLASVAIVVASVWTLVFVARGEH